MYSGYKLLPAGQPAPEWIEEHNSCHRGLEPTEKSKDALKKMLLKALEAQLAAACRALLLNPSTH